MESFTITGKISSETLAEALRTACPDRKITILSHQPESLNHVTGDIIITTEHDESFQTLLSRLEEKEKALKEAEEARTKAVISVQVLHKQQQDLFNEFALLRKRYDEQKVSIVSTLWFHCAKYHPELREIPPIEDAQSFTETDSKVGHYCIGNFLGEGQFASVRGCWLEGSEPSIDNTTDTEIEEQYALKMIRKDKIMNFTALTRVSNEIENLRQLHSPYIVSVVQVMHTKDMLYIVTEKGGRDLFEFFDEHPDGVCEEWAREIMSGVLKGVLYCHDHEICHRDLKPENILLTFDSNSGKCIDLQLCDFGLSTKFKPKQALKDFCGSPGFFAPEMIIHGIYFGDKIDVWSTGCIMLELILGHERFCDAWMIAYDYDLLQDKELFTNTISDTVDGLSGVLSNHNDLSSECVSFVLKFLELRSSRRPTTKTICTDAWLKDTLDQELSQLLHKVGPPLLGIMTPSVSLANLAAYSSPDANAACNNGNAPMMTGSFNMSGKHIGGGNITPDAIRAAYSNMSDKERRHMEEYIQHHQQQPGHEEEEAPMHLPPIIPSTPSLKHAKKILLKGDELAAKDYGMMVDPSVIRGGMTTPDSMSPSPCGKAFFSSSSVSGTPQQQGHAASQQRDARSPLPSVQEGHDENGLQSVRSQDNQHHGSSSSGREPSKPSLLVSHSESLIWNATKKE